MSLTPELYDLIVKIVDDRVKEVRVTREEFDRLRETLDERLSKLEEAVIRLAEAQRRTEERVEALAEAQRRTEERVEALAEAQRRTEDTLGRLIAGLDSLRVEVGRLSETIGFGLEDIARVVLPGWIHRHLGVEVKELAREFVKINGKEVEVDLYGEGTFNSEKRIIVGEVKSRIGSSDVNDFYNNIYSPMVMKTRTGVIGMLFGYLIHPSAKELAGKLGLYVVASYER